MFVDILNLPDLKKYDLSSLSLSAMGGAPCPLELAKQAASDLNIKHCLVFKLLFFKFKFKTTYEFKYNTSLATE